MPTFDVVSEVDQHELANAIDQTRRELQNRFDFRGVDASVTLADGNVILHAPEDFQIAQVRDILAEKLAKREIDARVLEEAGTEGAGKVRRMTLTVRQGVDRDTAGLIVKKVKAQKMKVQVAIQGDKVRVTGKKRDDLQQVMAMLKEAEIALPLQYNNFRD